MQDSEKRTSHSDDIRVLADRIQQLEKEIERLKTKRRKPQLQLSTIASYALLLVGALALIASALYASLISAFIGLGLTFWGALLLYVRPQRYMRASLLDSTATPLLKTINHILANNNVQGRGVHLPPKDLTELRGGKVFIPTENRNPSESQHGIYIAPTGLGLVNLYERELGTDFNRVDLNYLISNLPKVFIEHLEMAEDFEMTTENDVVHVKITGSIYKSLCNEVSGLPNVCNSLGCPLCSSIACALARATGKPIIIEKNGQSTDGETIEAHYRIITEE